MRSAVVFAALLLGCLGASSRPAAPPPPSPSPVAASEPEPEDTAMYRCSRLGGDRPVSIHIRAGYTAADVASWMLAWSCRTVVVPSFASERRARAGYSRLVKARELDRVLDELVAGLGLAAVTQGQVTVLVDADERLRDGKPGVVWQPADPNAPAKEQPPEPAGITKIDDFTFEITREALDRILSAPAKLGRGARLVPSFKNGKPDGFKIYAIRPGSAYARLGLHNGDAIHRINGHPLSTPDKALEVYTQIKDASTITVELSRRGRPAAITYRVVE